MLLANLISAIASTLVELRVLLARAQSINFESVTIDLGSQDANEPELGFSRTFADLPQNVSIFSVLPALYYGAYDDDYESQYADKIKYIAIQSTVDYTRVYVYFKESISIADTFRVEIKYLTIS